MRYLFVLLLLVGCGQQKTPAEKSGIKFLGFEEPFSAAHAQLPGPKNGEAFIGNRYQLVAATDGAVWRVDTATGVVHRCSGSSTAVTCMQAK